MQLAAGDRIADYEILGLLGKGGQSVVYHAIDLQLRRPVAIKFLGEELLADEVSRKRFLLEAQALSTLNHPHIASVYHIGSHRDVPFIAMEYVEGKTLHQYLASHRLPERELLELMIQITGAIRHAHGKGVVHRDLKPGNILVDAEGLPKLVDFGLAKITRSAVRNRFALPEELTASGSVLGTVSYLSPEQARGEPVDERSDLFSLGIIFHEMLTGRRPFDGDTPVSTLLAILREEPVHLEPSANPQGLALQPVLARLLEKNPAGRYADASLLLNDLIQYRDTSTLPRRIRFLHRFQISRRKFLVAGAVLFLLAAALWFASRLWPESGPAEKTAILVLPLQAGSEEKNRYLANLITTEIITRLNRSPGLLVLSPPPGVTAGQDRWVEIILSRHRVAYTISGTLALAGEELQVRVQMLDQQDCTVTWSRQFREDLPKIYTIPGIVAGQVAFETGVYLEAGKLEFPGRQAFDQYTRGGILLESYDPALLSEATGCFKKCLQVAPGFLPAYEKLCSAFLQYRNLGVDYSPDYLDQACRYARSGLRLDPRSETLQGTLAWFHLYTYGFQEANRILGRLPASISESSSLSKCRAWTAIYFGQTGQALDMFRQITRNDPHHTVAFLNLVVLNAMLGNRTDAGTAYREGRELFASSMTGPIMTGWWQISQNDFLAARETFLRAYREYEFHLIALAAAEVAFARQDYGEAARYLEIWLNSNPYSVEGYWMLVLCHRCRGDQMAARQAAGRGFTFTGKLLGRYSNPFLQTAHRYFGMASGDRMADRPELAAQDTAGLDSMTRYLHGIMRAEEDPSFPLEAIPCPYSPTFWMNRFHREELRLLQETRRRIPGTAVTPSAE